jgi:phytoene desaturase
MDRLARSYFRDERMVQFFDRYATYNGSNPYRTPGTLAIIPHVEYDLGAVAADEGIYSIPTAIARLAEEGGVRFHYGVRVERILVDSSRRVTGIVAATERLSFDAVVSNVDVVASYERLLDDPDAPLAKRYRRLEPSSSGLVFYFGMDESFPELSLHNIFFSGDYRAEFADIFERRRCPVDPTVYVNITSKTTPADAPAGGENWFVLVNAPYDAGQSWAGEAERTRKAVLERLSSALGRDVERHIGVESSMNPGEIAERTGSRFGSLYGISSNSRLAAFLRHPNRSSRHRGLYFCGGSVHPGGGMPLVVLSGKIASQLLQKDIERRKI